MGDTENLHKIRMKNEHGVDLDSDTCAGSRMSLQLSNQRNGKR